MLLLRHGIPRPDPKPSSVGTFRPGRRPRSAMFRTGCPAATAHRPRPATCKRLRARAGTDRFDRTDATVTKRVVVVPILNNTTYIFIWYIPYIYTPYTYTVHKWNTHTHVRTHSRTRNDKTGFFSVSLPPLLHTRANQIPIIFYIIHLYSTRLQYCAPIA